MAVVATVTVDWEPGAQTIDAAIPHVISSLLESACHSVDTTLQLMGVQGVSIGLELVENADGPDLDGPWDALGSQDTP